MAPKKRPHLRTNTSDLSTRIPATDRALIDLLAEGREVGAASVARDAITTYLSLPAVLDEIRLYQDRKASGQPTT